MSEPTTMIELPEGRVLACDDVGDPGGRAVISVHGTPDSRLARHPDDGFAAFLGVRLIAVDRPGFGHSSPHPDGTMSSFGRDIGRLADALHLDSFAVLGWSAGAMPALAVAAVQPERVIAVGIAAGIPPFEAYLDPAVFDSADAAHQLLAEVAREIGAQATAAELAPYLVPQPITPDLAREHLLAGADPVRRAELESVPGAVEVMAAAMVDSVRNGLGGITRDLELQILDPEFDLSAVTCRTTLWYGSADTTAPPAFGRWYADRLPDATLHILDGAGHCFAIPRWSELLTTLCGPHRPVTPPHLH